MQGVKIGVGIGAAAGVLLGVVLIVTMKNREKWIESLEPVGVVVESRYQPDHVYNEISGFIFLSSELVIVPETWYLLIQQTSTGDGCWWEVSQDTFLLAKEGELISLSPEVVVQGTCFRQSDDIWDTSR